jgi:D-galactarolactone cycloisomerase
MALWDLRGKALGSSIADLLGGRFRSDVEAYVTSFYSDDSGPRVSESAAKAVDYMAAGYTAFKVKIGFGIARDVELVSAIREAVGDGPKILVDANRGYTFALAKRLIGPMSALRVEWIEEPLALTEVHGYELLRSVSQDVLIAGGEGEATVLGFWPLLEMGLVDVLQPDLGVAGGFTGVLPIVELAQRTGQIVCPHVWGTVIGQAAALQMLACIPDTPLSRGGYQPMFEYDLSEHPFRTELSADRLQAVDGRISIPSGPGLGLTVDDDALERLAKCSWT